MHWQRTHWTPVKVNGWFNYTVRYHWHCGGWRVCDVSAMSAWSLRAEKLSFAGGCWVLVDRRRLCTCTVSCCTGSRRAAPSSSCWWHVLSAAVDDVDDGNSSQWRGWAVSAAVAAQRRSARLALRGYTSSSVDHVSVARQSRPPTSRDISLLHRESKKQATVILSTTSPNVDRFSKCFQWEIH